MNTLEISKETEAEILKAELNCAKTLNRIVDGNTTEMSDDERKMADVCLRGLKTASTNRQTTTARLALSFSMVSLIGNEKEVKKYVQQTNPQVTKALKA